MPSNDPAVYIVGVYILYFHYFIDSKSICYLLVIESNLFSSSHNVKYFVTFDKQTLFLFLLCLQ